MAKEKKHFQINKCNEINFINLNRKLNYNNYIIMQQFIDKIIITKNKAIAAEILLYLQFYKTDNLN